MSKNKWNRYIFRGGEGTLSKLFASLLKRDLLQRKEFAPEGANSFLWNRPLFIRDLECRKANRKSQKLFHFVFNVYKYIV